MHKARAVARSSAVSFFVISIVSSSAVVAAASVAQAFSIPAGAAAQAFRQFSLQSNLQVLFPAEAVEELETRRVQGSLTASDALDTMLDGTGLGYDFINDRTVTILPQRAGSDREAELLQSTRLAQGAEEGGRTRKSPSHRNAVDVDPVSTAEVGNEAASSLRNDENGPRTYIPEVLVRGSRSTNTDLKRDKDDVQPYVVIGREKIQRSSASTVEDFLKSELPMNTATESVDQFAQGANLVEGGINLRGLGANQTLILIDGRRLPGVSTLTGAWAQPNISGIPLSSIERIEILPSTAGAIYGGGATGGVINIIRKRDFSGVDVGIKYGNTFTNDAEEVDYHINGGFSGTRTSFMLGVSRSESKPLRIVDRNFAERARSLAFANVPDQVVGSFAPPTGTTPNICSATRFFGFSFCSGPSLVLDSGQALGTPITFVPDGYLGPSSDNGAALVNNAGQYNLLVPNDGQYLVRSPTRDSVTFDLRHSLHDRVEIQLSGSRNRSITETSVGGAAASVFVPSTAANNPFQQDVLVQLPLPLPPRLGENHVEVADVSGGLILHLPGGWSGSIDRTWGASEYTYGARMGGVVSDTELAALSLSSVIFQDTTQNPPSFASVDSAFDQLAGPFRQTIEGTSIRFSGPAFVTRSGPLTLTGLIERLDNRADGAFLHSPGLIAFLPPRSRSTESYYLEASLPLIASPQNYPLVDSFEVQASVRHDRYSSSSTVGLSIANSVEDPFPSGEYQNNRVSSTDYLWGFKYAPIKDVAIRVSRGTGFLPAGLDQLVPITRTSQGSIALDPQRGGSPLPGSYTTVVGGNPNLQPEQSASWSAGVIFTPSFLEGARLSIDYTYIKKDGEITAPIEQFILDNEDRYALRVTRGENLSTDPPGWAGPITRLDTSLLNVFHTTVKSLDLQLDYRRSMQNWGTFLVSAIATQSREFSRQISTDTQTVDSVGFRDGPLKWKGEIELGWEWRQWAATWESQYFDSYLIFGSTTPEPFRESSVALQGAPSIPKQIYHNLSLNYRSPQNAWGLLSDTTVSFGVNNVFNKSPPVLATLSLDFLTGNTYSTVTDPRLRRYFLSIEKSF